MEEMEIATNSLASARTGGGDFRIHLARIGEELDPVPGFVGFFDHIAHFGDECSL